VLGVIGKDEITDEEVLDEIEVEAEYELKSDIILSSLLLLLLDSLLYYYYYHQKY
jgi:hypothetical protein